MHRLPSLLNIHRTKDISTLVFYAFSFYFNNAGITVALQQTTYNTAETDGPLSVCIQMFVGNLQRNVSLSVITTDGSAICMPLI